MWQLRAHNRSRSFILGVALASAGVALADPVPVRPLKPRANPCAKAHRGINPNGPDFTGTSLSQNPSCPPLPQLMRARLSAGVTTDGKTLLKDYSFVAGEIKSAEKPAAPLPGAMLLGDPERLEGQVVRLRIDGIESAADPDPKTPINENADVRLYRVSAQLGFGNDPTDAQFRPNKPPTGEWAPLCPGGGLAVAVPGSWNYQAGSEGDGGKAIQDSQVITFACISSAIAKCVTMGYKPWKAMTDGKGGPAISFDALHQACVRAVRADYCGDGDSMTEAGTLVNFYDRAGIQRDTSDLPLEAVWSPEGALCVNSTRLATAPENLRTERPATAVLTYIKKHCAARLSDKPCDQAALVGKGGILWTEVQAAAAPPPGPKPRN